MKETILNILAALGPFLGAHLLIAIYYVLLTKVRIKTSNRKWNKPNSFSYLPIAFLGILLGNLFIEMILRRADSITGIYSDSFHFESVQSLSMLFGLVTYYLTLSEVFRWMKRRNSDYFIDRPQALNAIPQVKKATRLYLAAITLVALSSFVVFSLCLLRLSLISGFLDGIQNRPLNNIETANPLLLPISIVSLFLFIFTTYSAFRLMRSAD